MRVKWKRKTFGTFLLFIVHIIDLCTGNLEFVSSLSFFLDSAALPTYTLILGKQPIEEGQAGEDGNTNDIDL